MTLNEQWVHEGKKLSDELIAFRRDLHRFPELSFEETETAAKVAGELKNLGLQVKTGVGYHGVVADLESDLPGKTIALRADMDALPIQEETGLPFASTREGIMHACGHDIHTAVLLGAAKLLVQRREGMKGRVRFIFQSAEERNAGARAMIDAGVLDGIDEIYGLHNLPRLSAGKVETCSGAMMGASDRIELMIEGKGAHGALPQRGVDPIVAASAIIMALQTAISREISPFEPVVVTIGSIHSGNANNVIPQYAELTGTVRTISSELRKSMPDRLRRLVEQTAAAYRCKVDFRYIEQGTILVNNDDCVGYVNDVADLLIGRKNRGQYKPILAGEDFSYYLRQVPGCFFWLGSGPVVGAEEAFGLHHPRFVAEEACIPIGSSLLAAIAFQRCCSQ